MVGRLTLRPGPCGLLVAGALLGHWLVLDSVVDHLALQAIDSAMAPRLTTVYLRRLDLVEPPRVAPAAPPAAVAAAVAPPNRAPSALPPVAAASQPEAVSEPLEYGAEQLPSEPAPAPPPPALAADESTPEPPLAAVDPDVLSRQSEPTDDAPTAPAFVWPPSTRLSYVLTGNYRGEVHGSAQVEWINAEPRYQVNLDVTIGMPFAPLLNRQMRSDGMLGPDGLQPQRYDQRSKMAFQDPRATSLRFRERQVSTADGRPLPLPPAGAPRDGMHSGDFRTSLQDSASQFVQLTWLFTTQPQLLAPGTTIAFPLALPGRVADWRYEVGQAQTLYTRFGTLEAYRVFTAAGTDRRRDLLAEAWFAPQLAYLPVRIRIEQDTDVYLDLMIKEKPEIAMR
ncbi:DUF3108 domain-containing protein [Piscinibacter sakaiensis]|uniref:DUF3108 domain-containing protein n=1 Tax=Piscinibacter sakaiensis TaxID=1547922 RepID=UPI003AAE079D